MRDGGDRTGEMNLCLAPAGVARTLNEYRCLQARTEGVQINTCQPEDCPDDEPGDAAPDGPARSLRQHRHSAARLLLILDLKMAHHLRYAAAGLGTGNH